MKKVKSIFITGAILLLMTVFVSESYAQPKGRGWGRDGDSHAKNLENLRILKLLELLQLDEEQNTKFISAFVSFRKEAKEITAEIEIEVDSLIDILQQTEPPKENIISQISKIEDKKIQREKLVRDFHKEVASILTPVQLGKMVVFEEHFERELIESVRGFHNRNMPPMPDPDDVPGQ